MKKKNKTIYDKIVNLIKYNNGCDVSEINNYMIGVLEKFKTSIKIFHDIRQDFPPEMFLNGHKRLGFF